MKQVQTNKNENNKKTKNNSKSNEKAKLKIIDFGIAIEIEDDETNDEYVGTLLYLPPESTSTREGWELKKGDMWSVGIIAYVLGMYNSCCNFC